MAAKPSSSSSPGLLKLEEQLTCPVCLDLYTNPKTLPCLHSFCEACIERFPQDKESETYYLSCPTCRHRTELPGGGAGAFPVAFTLNNLKETYSLMKNAVIQPNTQQATMCKDHEKPLDFFCETCDEVICAHCTVRIHKHHEYDLITDSYTKHCEKLRESLPTVKTKAEALKNFLSMLAKREGEISERGEGVLEEIHEMVEEMINVLRESERKLSEEAKRVTDAKLEVLSGQAKSAQISLNLLEHIEDYVEQSLKVEAHEKQQVLRSKKQMMERMREATTQINVEELYPIEKVDIQMIKDTKTTESLHHVGDITYSALKLCKVNIKDKEHLLKEKRFSLSMKAPDSSLVSVPVSSLKCSLVPVGKGDEPIHTTVTTTSTHPGVYRIHCNPSIIGTHTVKVQVYDIELEDTLVTISYNPYLDNITPVRTITELNNPWGVAVSDDGHVIVTECFGNCVTILDNEGKKVKSFGGRGGSGNVEFYNPRGIAITPDNFILVSDNHRIQKINMDGYHVASVGEEGSGPLQFNAPDGIAISHITGQVYIADWHNHRIQVLNPDLTFSHSFGSEGSANGQFKYPHDIAIDSQGLVYVADTDNHRIQKFSPDGKFVVQFTNIIRPGNDCMVCPVRITIDTARGLVYVSEYGYHIASSSFLQRIYMSTFRNTTNTSPVERLLVFTTDGRFLHCISQFINPRGLTLDNKGLLYVCDNDNILIF